LGHHHSPFCDALLAMNAPLKKSAGVALITVLLVVAAATIAAVSISSRLQVDIRRTENLLRADQAWLHALGMESWAKSRLIEDFKNDRKEEKTQDDLKEEWVEVVEESVEGGTVQGEIIDQQGLFNLNNLLKQPDKDSESQQLVHSNIDIEYFKRLLNTLELDELPEDKVDELVNALLDWLDKDTETTLTKGIAGAEDDYYQTLEPVYNAANRPMAHQSELLLVKGFTLEIYRELAPLVTALPVPILSEDRTTINVNTAKKEVLQSIYKGITDSGADDLIDTQESDAFESRTEFDEHPAVSGLNVTKTKLGSVGLDVKSSYFRVKSIVEVGRARVAVTSLIKRTDAGEAEVLHRLREDIF